MDVDGSDPTTEQTSWKKELADRLAVHEIYVDWDMTDWEAGAELFFRHPASSIRFGSIVRRQKGDFGVIVEVRMYHSSLDKTGAAAVFERRLAPLVEDGARCGVPVRLRGNNNVWSASVYTLAADADEAVTWARRFVEKALDVVDMGIDGRAIDLMTMAFFREMLPVAQIFEKFSLGLHRRDWEGQERLPDYPRHEGPGVAVFFDSRGKIVLSLKAEKGQLDEAIDEAFDPQRRDFIIPDGQAEVFWQLPLESEMGRHWCKWISNWIHWWGYEQVRNPLDLDFEKNRWFID